ncbi:hypothetical protein, partial [Methylocystis sp. ATCC 49242]|uniref:hypothetical protein n=1 Tax=Methylocystis sp. ATCC 49242 TaxID=622637 RepID=UPI001AEBAEF6
DPIANALHQTEQAVASARFSKLASTGSLCVKATREAPSAQTWTRSRTGPSAAEQRQASSPLVWRAGLLPVLREMM